MEPPAPDITNLAAGGLKSKLPSVKELVRLGNGLYLLRTVSLKADLLATPSNIGSVFSSQTKKAIAIINGREFGSACMALMNQQDAQAEIIKLIPLTEFTAALQEIFGKIKVNGVYHAALENAIKFLE